MRLGGDRVSAAFPAIRSRALCAALLAPACATALRSPAAPEPGPPERLQLHAWGRQPDLGGKLLPLGTLMLLQCTDERNEVPATGWKELFRERARDFGYALDLIGGAGGQEPTFRQNFAFLLLKERLELPTGEGGALATAAVPTVGLFAVFDGFGPRGAEITQAAAEAFGHVAAPLFRDFYSENVVPELLQARDSGEWPRQRPRTRDLPAGTESKFGSAEAAGGEAAAGPLPYPLALSIAVRGKIDEIFAAIGAIVRPATRRSSASFSLVVWDHARRYVASAGMAPVYASRLSARKLVRLSGEGSARAPGFNRAAWETIEKWFAEKNSRAPRPARVVGENSVTFRWSWSPAAEAATNAPSPGFRREIRRLISGVSAAGSAVAGAARKLLPKTARRGSQQPQDPQEIAELLTRFAGPSLPRLSPQPPSNPEGAVEAEPPAITEKGEEAPAKLSELSSPPAASSPKTAAPSEDAENRREKLVSNPPSSPPPLPVTAAAATLTYGFVTNEAFGSIEPRFLLGAAPLTRALGTGDVVDAAEGGGAENAEDAAPPGSAAPPAGGEEAAIGGPDGGRSSTPGAGAPLIVTSTSFVSSHPMVTAETAAAAGKKSAAATAAAAAAAAAEILMTTLSFQAAVERDVLARVHETSVRRDCAGPNAPTPCFEDPRQAFEDLAAGRYDYFPYPPARFVELAAAIQEAVNERAEEAGYALYSRRGVRAAPGAELVDRGMGAVYHSVRRLERLSNTPHEDLTLLAIRKITPPGTQPLSALLQQLLLLTPLAESASVSGAPLLPPRTLKPPKLPPKSRVRLAQGAPH